jgi:hypothetical protein
VTEFPLGAWSAALAYSSPLDKPTCALDPRARRDLRIDDLERRQLAGLAGPLVDQPLTHKFVGDLYVRSVVNPVDSVVSTKIHKTAHPFFVLRGLALVSQDDGPPVEIEAPFSGVTLPGTRRVILAIREVEWVTVHAMTPEERDEPDQEKRLAMIEERLIERRELADGKTSHQLFREGYARQLSAGPKEIEE